MTDAPELLLAHHLKTLRLPTFLREYDKQARLAAAEGVDHVRYLARLTEDLKQKQPDITPEQVEEQYKEMGERQVRWEFLYHGIAQKESVEVTDEDIEAWLDRFAKNYGMTREDARKQLAGANQVARVRDTILENKVLDYLLEQGTVTELPAGSGIITPPGSSGNG